MKHFLLLSLLATGALSGQDADPDQSPPPRAEDFPLPWNPNERWGAEVAKLTRQAPSGPDSPVLFAGSSSFRLWDLSASFPGLEVRNHGFGGSTFPDLLHFAEELILNHRPQTLVIYEGDNDLHHGRTPEQVLRDWKSLTSLVAERLPGTPIVFVAIKPSVARWPLRHKVSQANTLIKLHCEAHDQLHFADVATVMLEFNGIPKAHLFERDALHLNASGYKLWTGVLHPLLKELQNPPTTEGDPTPEPGK